MRRCPLFRSLSGAKRAWVGALHLSASDPKRTSHNQIPLWPDNFFRLLMSIKLVSSRGCEGVSFGLKRKINAAFNYRFGGL